ncbi:fibroleukin-like [Engraulis encrasicolus]|uniref:fibroleukin-like n=1 Tax=Engraulis encrasicolus TaxID=184585 RepID=UPI002FD5E83F
MVTARDCSDYAVMGRRQDGVYRVSPDPRLGGAVPVWCDMASLGGGWTVIQRRANGTENFNRSWADYKKGFGELGGDLWLGLELVHWLTRGRDMVLRIELQDSRGRREYAKYEQFYVAGEQLRYKLSVGGYSGTAGDALASGEGGSGSGSFRHDQMFFSTADQDNDAYTKGSCAAYYGSGWWFNACMAANLNGRHYRQRYRGVRNGIFWSTWPNVTGTHEPPLTGYRDAFRYAKMMIRPRNYSP